MPPHTIGELRPYDYKMWPLCTFRRAKSSYIAEGFRLEYKSSYVCQCGKRVALKAQPTCLLYYVYCVISVTYVDL